MSSRQYPRLGDAKNITEKQKRRPINHKKRGIACGQEATHAVWIQVDWFRGNDEGPVHACKDHRADQRLIDSHFNSREGQVMNTKITAAQARLIIDAHDIRLDEDDEETTMLRENNPELYIAYSALIEIAESDHG